MDEENGASGTPINKSEIDLVGGPFAVVESDPGVFTTLIRKLGIQGIEVDEVYDIQPWGLDHLKPRGLILCFNWKHDKHHPHDFLDPAAKDIWFANQLADDACASLAILNVLLNCRDVELGDELEQFKRETFDMSPKMKGLAISNSRLLREAQNSLARPADMWGSISATAEATHSLHQETKRPAKKRTKTSHEWSSPKKRKSSKAKLDSETFHFIGYVPAHGKVWELDGLKAGPLEVGELPGSDSDSDSASTEGWENVVRPALRLKMQKYGALSGGMNTGSIQFNLLALVQDRYEVRSDELELLKREKAALEARLSDCIGDSWREKVDGDLLSSSGDIFTTLVQPSTPGRTFAKDFGARYMDRKVSILNMSPDQLIEAWESCVTRAMPVKIVLDEEVQKAIDARTETEKRTHDYTPFISEFLTSLHNEGLLAQLIASNKA